MVTIVTRTANGAALTTAQMDTNLTNLNTKVELSDLSVTTAAEAETAALSYNNATGVFTFTPVATDDLVVLDDFSVTTGAASGAGSLSYNNTTGEFTFNPVDVNLVLTEVEDDSAPVLGGSLDVNDFSITTTVTDGHIVINPNGSGTVKAFGALDTVSGTLTTSTTNGHIDLSANGTGNIRVGQAITHINTNADLNIDSNGTGMINLNGSVNIEDLTSFAETIEVLGGVSGTLSIDASDGPIKYVVPAGPITINGFASPVGGQTVTMLIDQATYSSDLGSITLGAGLLTPEGDGVTLTDSGYDLVTITCVDDVNGVYIVTSINNFQ